MPRILDYHGQRADRAVTVAGIRALKSQRAQLAQVTASTAEESAAAEATGIEMAVCLSQVVPAVREGSSITFVTAAIDFEGDLTVDDLLGRALKALSEGADAIITARRLEVVERLAAEDTPGARMHEERRRALGSFRADVASGSFPNDDEVVLADADELARFIERLDCVRGAVASRPGTTATPCALVGYVS